MQYDEGRPGTSRHIVGSGRFLVEGSAQEPRRDGLVDRLPETRSLFKPCRDGQESPTWATVLQGDVAQLMKQSRYWAHKNRRSSMRIKARSLLAGSENVPVSVLEIVDAKLFHPAIVQSSLSSAGAPAMTVQRRAPPLKLDGGVNDG